MSEFRDPFSKLWLFISAVDERVANDSNPGVPVSSRHRVAGFTLYIDLPLSIRYCVIKADSQSLSQSNGKVHMTKRQAKTVFHPGTT